MSVFLDSNVVIYAVSNDEVKRAKAETLLEARPVVSTQVMGEMAAVLRRKMHLSYDAITPILSGVFSRAKVVPITVREIQRALSIGQRYGYAFYDSLILAAALESECAVLYSEDMAHGQRIEGRLTLLNPFIGG